MKKILSILILISACLSARAADIITATIAVTNAAGTTNGQTITVNANVRTWTNSVGVPASQILTNATAAGSATNLYFQVAQFPYTGLSLNRTTSTNITLQTAPGGALAVTLSAGWGTVTLSTQSLVTATVVRVPKSAESAAVKTNISSGLVSWISDDANTNEIQQASKAAIQLAGLTNSQTIGGAKIFTNKTSRFDGIVSNSPAISGNVLALTNGIWTNAILTGPTITNATFYGGFNSFVGNVDFSGDVTFNGNASSITASDTMFTLLPENSASPIYLGNSGAADGVTAYQGYFSNSVTAASATLTNLNMRGGSVFANTNLFPANSDVAFTRLAVTSLANGNNAAVPVGTNVFIEVSGPSASFTINGIAAGNAQRDGKIIYIVNQTGFDMTIAHQSGTDPTAANRIITMTGADRATTGNGCATLIYSGSASRWILISFDP